MVEPETKPVIVKHKVKGPYEAFVKRLLDITVALTVIALFWWLYAIIAILVRFRLGSPVLFSQDRPGMIDSRTGHERVFKLYKFRSMTDERDVDGNLLPGSVRLTPFGAKLRSTSLDELPEIINILKGDMSIIGPRPLATIYLPWYTERERMRHAVRPGLTGLAQASGRNNLLWEDRFALDLEYVDNITFLMDCKVVLKTVKAVLIREGIGQGEESPESFHVYRQRQLKERLGE